MSEEKLNRTIGAAEVVNARAEKTIERVDERTATRDVSGPRTKPRACIVLIIDDEAPVTKYVAQIAEAAGLVPLIAHDLVEASQMLAANDVRRVVIDCGFGDSDTLLFVASCKQKGIDVTRDALVYTGHDSKSSVACRYGVPVLTKPSLPELRAWMKRRV